MTDVYIAYAREDRDRVRLITEMLRFEGWDLWMDPFDLSDEISPAAELKLGTARVILAFWSDRSRTSEIVRSEAATGLYKNKLMQARIDGGAPPRPFDQVESLDFSHWRGDIDDPVWRRLTSGLKQHAGEPAGTRALQQAGRKPALQQSTPMQPPGAPSQATVLPLSLSQPRQYAQPQPEPLPQPPTPQRTQPMFQAPPLAPPQPPPGFHVPPPQPLYQAPPPYPPAAPPLQPMYQSQPPAPPPSYQMAPQHHAPRPVVFDTPPPQPQRPLQPQPLPPHDNQWRREAPGQLDFPESGSGRSGGSIGYAKPRGGAGMTWGPAAAAVVLIASGVGLWFADPFGWRPAGAPTEAEPVAMAARTVADAPIANAEPAAGTIEDTPESAASWQRVNRKSADALRDFVTEFPRASSAETARSLLRVLDAQAWVSAVTADNETAYQAYLKRFPSEGVMAGAMASAATERLAALGDERRAAVEEIQRGLSALNLYSGPLDGKTGGATAAAVAKFAASNRRAAPSLTSASPRELRAFAENVRRAGARDIASAEVAAASEADLLRVAQAQAKAASLAAAPVPGAVSADGSGLNQQQRQDEQRAWATATEAGTLPAYETYLKAWPNGPNAAAARAAVTKLNKPAPYSLDQLSADVRSGVEAARKAQATANQRAAAARQAASSAENLADGQSITGANGDRYDTQIANGAPNGLGVRTRGAGAYAGDRYRGQLRNGQSSGVGVYEFAENPSNAGGRALRYEGEYAGDAVGGHGIFYWRSGDNFAGLGAGSSGQARGVLTYENGQRYEGELSAGRRDGVGVVWAGDGSILQAGRWAKDALIEPMKAPAP